MTDKECNIKKKVLQKKSFYFVIPFIINKFDIDKIFTQYLIVWKI